MSIKVEKRGAIAILSIDRPKAMNALSRQIVDEMDVQLDAIAADKEVRALIIYSEKNFAAGADIKEMVHCTPEEAGKFSFIDTYNKLAALPIPTIAAIEGYALGGGLELALACDLRLADEGAVMGFPEIKLGIMPGAGGTIRAPRLIGAARAIELIFTGANVKADRAEEIGLVNRVVPAGTVLAEAEKLAGKLCRMSPIALATAKETIRQGLEIANVAEATKLEAVKWSGMFATNDQTEGMTAFIEKRPAVYTGT